MPSVNYISLCDSKVVYSNRKLISFIYPCPKGSEENQFAPFRAGVNKLVFRVVLQFGESYLLNIYQFVKSLLIIFHIILFIT
jgi:hypothetical protein